MASREVGEALEVAAVCLDLGHVAKVAVPQGGGGRGVERLGICYGSQVWVRDVFTEFP